MPPAHRVGDRAFNPADSHGCPACPHPVQGPATSGSPDVMVNGVALMRVGDPGLHAACCGPNSWKVASGSATVRVNGIPPARIGDATTHCGGSGKVIGGSSNVMIGDKSPAVTPVEPVPQKPVVPVLIEAVINHGTAFVNLPDDEGQRHGRKFKVKARIDPPQAGIPVFFRLPEVTGNATEGLEAEQPARLLQTSAVTNGAGEAEALMEVSAIGGDRHYVEANLEEGSEVGAVSTGLLEVMRKLRFSLTEMQLPEGGWLSWPWAADTFQLPEPALERAKEGLGNVYVELEDSGERGTGEFVPFMTLSETKDWCQRNMPAGPAGGDVPQVNIGIVSRIVQPVDKNNIFAAHKEYVDATLGADDVYRFTLPETPYANPRGVTEMGRVDVRRPEVAPWSQVARPFVMVTGTPLESRDCMMLARELPPEVGKPPVLKMRLIYPPLNEINGVCFSGGRYVVLSAYETELKEADPGEIGDTLTHEIGHALGLALHVATQDPQNRGHCTETHCTMFAAASGRPFKGNVFHGGAQPKAGSCAEWVRRLDMSKEHLYQRWWSDGRWPTNMTIEDAERGCPCVQP